MSYIGQSHEWPDVHIHYTVIMYALSLITKCALLNRYDMILWHYYIKKTAFQRPNWMCNDIFRHQHNVSISKCLQLLLQSHTLRKSMGSLNQDVNTGSSWSSSKIPKNSEPLIWLVYSKTKYRLWCKGSWSYRPWCKGSWSYRLWCKGSWSYRLWCKGSWWYRLWCKGSWSYRLWCKGSWYFDM